jgi:hypothetical protein
LKRSSTIMTDISCRVKKPLYSCTTSWDREHIASKPRHRRELILMISPPG